MNPVAVGTLRKFDPDGTIVVNDRKNLKLMNGRVCKSFELQKNALALDQMFLSRGHSSPMKSKQFLKERYFFLEAFSGMSLESAIASATTTSIDFKYDR